MYHISAFRSCYTVVNSCKILLKKDGKIIQLHADDYYYHKVNLLIMLWCQNKNYDSERLLYMHDNTLETQGGL